MTFALAAALLLAAPTFSLSYKGSLHDALTQVAEKGKINVVLASPLEQTVELHLNDITAEDALESLAETYGLDIDKHGAIWTVRAEDAEEKAEAPPTPVAEEKDDGKSHDYSVVGPGHVAADQTVQDAAAYGGPLNVEGTVLGDAAAMGGNLDVHGTIRGDASAMGGSLHCFPGGHIHGDAQAFGGSVIRDTGCKIDGDMKTVGGKVAKEVIKRPDGAESGFSSKVSSFLIWFALLFGMGFLAMIFAPQRMRQLELEIRADPVRCGLTGMVGLMALIPLTILLCFTIIGAPFAFFLDVMAMVGVAMGVAAIASEIGLKLPFFRGRKTQAIVLAAGLLIVLLLEKIPVLGPIGFFFVCLVALGAIIRTRFGNGPRQGIPEPIDTPAAVPQ